MTRDRFADTHIDDGMRHSGLVPSTQERFEEKRRKEELAREARISANAARADLARKVLATVSAEARAASRRFLVRFVDHVGGTNCATWECKKCQGQWVSPANQECPHCHANETIPALTDDDAVHNAALEEVSAALHELFVKEGIDVTD